MKMAALFSAFPSDPLLLIFEEWIEAKDMS